YAEVAEMHLIYDAAQSKQSRRRMEDDPSTRSRAVACYYIVYNTSSMKKLSPMLIPRSDSINLFYFLQTTYSDVNKIRHISLYDSDKLNQELRLFRLKRCSNQRP
ncbi:hypothetical protein L9F63_019145, partial [Diploptera punctata]